MDNWKLRKQLRQKRRVLDSRDLEAHSDSICQHLWQHAWIKSATHIALYLPNEGEPDVTGLIDQATAKNRFYYLPCLDSLGRNHMVFRRWSPEDALVNNKFGIPEPQKGKIMPAWALSVVLTPLVAFDTQGNRLGMGAGYYDRTFFMRRGGVVQIPRLVGIAHDFQEVAKLVPQPWDVPLDLVVTESRTITPDRTDELTANKQPS